MKVPNIKLAIVAERKLTIYLLNPSHPVGSSKARFFLRFGFSAENWQLLAERLRLHGVENEIVSMEPTKYGMRFAVDGLLEAPDGTHLNLRTAWFISSGESNPVFVTAYPLLKNL